jgi:hypothetical protein
MCGSKNGRAATPKANAAIDDRRIDQSYPMARSQSSESTAALTFGTKDGDFAQRPRYGAAR